MKDPYQQFFGTRNTLPFALYIVAVLCMPLLILANPNAGYIPLVLMSLFSVSFVALALFSRQRNSSVSVPSLAILPLRQDR